MHSQGLAPEAPPRRQAFATATAVVALIAIATLLRLALATAGLGEDETYMVSMARHFSWSYFDHPPLHVWLVGGWARLLGSEDPWVVRLPFIALFVGSSWLMYRLTAALFGERAGFWATLAFNLAPLFTLSTGSWVLPDGPLVFFLLAAGRALADLLIATESPTRPVLRWLGVGLLAGLALLSKYTAIFFIAGAFAFLVSDARSRHWFKTPGPWLGLLAAVAVFLPVVYWNMTHRWISFAFQAGRGARAEFNLNWLLQYLGGEILYLLPWILVPLIVAWLGALRRGPKDRASWLLACLASGPIVIFTLAAFWSHVLPHWPLAGWLFVFPLLGVRMVGLSQRHPRLVWHSSLAAVLVLVGGLAVVASQAATGWITRLEPGLAGRRDPTISLVDWRELRAELANRGDLKDVGFLAGLNWIHAARLDYALGRDIPVLCLCAEPHHFAIEHDPRLFEGRDGLVIGTTGSLYDPLGFLAGRFQRVELLAPVSLTRAGQPVIEIWIVRGFGFKSATP
jgi:4-amino-4-deoxy-L-arabinose transferase-like glycosyltransferase